jgi:hypothetical protein
MGPGIEVAEGQVVPEVQFIAGQGAVAQLGNAGGRNGAQLIQAGLAMDDEGTEVPQLAERSGDEVQERGVGHAHHLPARARGVRERPEHVHDGGHAQLAADRRHVAHGGVQQRREHENDPGLLQHLRHPFGRELDAHTQCLEDVGTAAAGGEGAVAVLGDTHAGAGGHERSGCGDVERGQHAAAGAARVHQAVDVPRRHGHHGPPQRTDAAGQDRRCLAAGAQRDQEGGDLHVRGAAGHHLGEGGLGVSAIEPVGPGGPGDEEGQVGLGGVFGDVAGRIAGHVFPGAGTGTAEAGLRPGLRPRSRAAAAAALKAYRIGARRARPHRRTLPGAVARLI